VIKDKTIHNMPEKAFHAQPDDLDYERESSYFFSGLGYHMMSRDSGQRPSVLPARHGFKKVFVDNIPWDVSLFKPMIAIVLSKNRKYIALKDATIVVGLPRRIRHAIPSNLF
jgi:hypothetical protein